MQTQMQADFDTQVEALRQDNLQLMEQLENVSRFSQSGAGSETHSHPLTHTHLHTHTGGEAKVYVDMCVQTDSNSPPHTHTHTHMHSLLAQSPKTGDPTGTLDELYAHLDLLKHTNSASFSLHDGSSEHNHNTLGVPISLATLSAISPGAWDDIQRLRQKVREADKNFEDEHRELSKLMEQNDLLKKELRKTESLYKAKQELAGSASVEYLKHTFLKFLESDTIGSSEHEALIPVLFKLLSITPEEQARIVTKRCGKSGLIRGTLDSFFSNRFT